jgi:hypothetical protein
MEKVWVSWLISTVFFSVVCGLWFRHKPNDKRMNEEFPFVWPRETRWCHAANTLLHGALMLIVWWAT